MPCHLRGPHQMENNPQDRINQHRDITDGCGPAGSVKGKLYNKIPNNGEYEWAGEGGGCHYASSKSGGYSMTCSAGCTHGHCAIAGRKGTYKRVRYKASDNSCCTGQAAGNWTVGKVTCHPDARGVTKTRCVPIMKKECAGGRGDNIFGKSYCQEFCLDSKYKPWCDQQKTTRCSTAAAMNTSGCKTWCMANPDKCTKGIGEMCKGDTIFTQDVCSKWCEANQRLCMQHKKAYCNNVSKIQSDAKCSSFCASNLNECKDGIQNYCKQGDNLFNKKICTDFCDEPTNETWCKNAKSTYCSANTNNLKKGGCQAFCMGNYGKCDSSFESYCDAEKAKPAQNQDKRCSCLNSSMKEYNPLCVDKNCIATGYATHGMLVSKGNECNITNCNQYLTFADDIVKGNIEVTSKFLQECGQTIQKDKETDSSGTGTNNNASAPSSPPPPPPPPPSQIPGPDQPDSIAGGYPDVGGRAQAGVNNNFWDDTTSNQATAGSSVNSTQPAQPAAPPPPTEKNTEVNSSTVNSSKTDVEQSSTPETSGTMKYMYRIAVVICIIIVIFILYRMFANRNSGSDHKEKHNHHHHY